MNSFSTTVEYYVRSIRTKQFFWGFLTTAAIITVMMGRFFLTYDYQLTVYDSRIDDLLYIKNAYNLSDHFAYGPYDPYILSNKAYDPYTLSKSPLISYWIALTHSIGIPLLQSEQVFYGIVCLILYFAIRPFFSRWQAFFIFFVLLFNPMTLSANLVGKVGREGIYHTITLGTVACFIGIYIRQFTNASKRALFFWSILGGLFLGAFWLTREEGFWIAPGPLLLFVASLVSHPSLKERMKTLYVFSIPMLICTVSVLSVMFFHYALYGVLSVTDRSTSNYKSAYGLLLGIADTLSWKQYVHVPKEVRAYLYQVSPAFRELKDWLERPDAVTSGCNALGICNDIGGNWFEWEFRGAVDRAGYYSSFAKSDEYFFRLKKELELVCQQKKIHCAHSFVTIVPLFFHGEYVPQFILTLFRFTERMVVFSDFSTTQIVTLASPHIIDLFRFMTGATIVLSPTELRFDYAMSLIVRSYKIFSAVIFFSTPIIAAYITIHRRKILKREWGIITILVALGSMVVTRLSMLSFIQITSFPVYSFYFSPLYPLMLLGESLLIIVFFRICTAECDRRFIMRDGVKAL